MVYVGCRFAGAPWRRVGVGVTLLRDQDTALITYLPIPTRAIGLAVQPQAEKQVKSALKQKPRR